MQSSFLASNTRLARVQPFQGTRQAKKFACFAFQRNAKRLRYANVGHQGGKGMPKVISLEADGSDTWRVDEAVEIIKNGGVSAMASRYAC